MPIYEYECKQCKTDVEILLMRQDQTPQCPTCGGEDLARQFSVTAAPAMASGRKTLPMASPGEGCGAPRCCGGGCATD